MRIYIIFPKQYFTREQLGKLKKYNPVFLEGKEIDLEKIKELHEGKEYILAVDPTYLKDHWKAFPVDRVKKMKGLKALCLTTTAFGWVDGKKLAEMGIVVTNTPGKSTHAVAEFNILMMLSLLRKLPLIIKNKWKMDYDHFLNEEADRLAAGILGLGKIGTQVAVLCKGLGMNVCYWNRSKKRAPFRPAELANVLKESDVVFNTLATPPELKGFIGKNLLSKMKKSAIIISTSDTGILDTPFILQQVKREKLGGFAFESIEKTAQDFKGNVMVFPEQAYYTRGTLLNTARIITDTILSVINNKPINKIN